MDDEQLTLDDLVHLDREVQKEMDKHNDTSGSRLQHYKQTPTPSTIDNVDIIQINQMIADCFDDDTDAQMEHIECLKSKFKHNSFRTKQWDIIKTISEGRDVCAVMATGYGKSLCFQFPAIYSNRMALVISPLIALMQAQVMDLQRSGISACLVGSAQKDLKILERIANGTFNVVYSSPEYLQTANGDKLLSIVRGRLALVAIDEAHCVSQWGHDFRQDFRKLNIIRSKIPNTPILAVTATATENVRLDIINLLGLQKPRVIMTSFDRANLEFIVKRKTNVRNDLLELVKNVDGSVIVYVLKRKDAEDIAKQLQQYGVYCEHYHAGLDINKRTEVLDKFLKDELKVIVATIAFGMGIDKKDIRCVIHYGASKNLESYYQEVGRAGRDQKASKVITYFSPDDFELHDWFLEQESAKKNLSSVIQNYLRSLAAKMRDFLYSTQCRRKIILEYFGETTALTPRPNCCDNCTIGLTSWKLTDLYNDVDENGIHDFGFEAKILLESIICLQRNDISTERNLLKKFLTGKFDQRLRVVQQERWYASGHIHPEQYWVSLAEQLIHDEYIDMSNGNKLTLKTKAEKWLRNAVSLPLKAIGQMFEYFPKKQSTPLVVGKANRYTVTRAVADLMRKEHVLCDELLKQILSRMRDAISETKSISDKESIGTMSDFDNMVKAKPRNLDEFRFAAFNDEKLNKYGPTFVNAISKFMRGELEMQNVLLNHPMPNVKMDRVISPQILRLLKNRKTKVEIFQLTNLTENQLFNDIETLIQTGQPVLKTDLAYISLIDFKVLRQCINEQDGNITTNITDEMLNELQTKYFNSSNDQIDSGFLRLALVYYAVRFHLNRLGVPYIDGEDNLLINAEQLIVAERQQSVNSNFQTDRQYPPYRRNHYVAQTVMDLFFGNCFSSYEHYGESEYEYDYGMDEDEYEHLGSVNSGESNGRSDAETNEESDENSVEESESEVEEDNESEVEEESETDGEAGLGTETDEGSDTNVSSDGSDSDFNYETRSRKRQRLASDSD